jgi:predicted RNA-binding Zn-ribbon protein involved in translation (DUF1610 family)
MNHLFCTHCGFKIEYNNSKPNFCPKCGQSVGGVVNTSSHKTRSPASPSVDLYDSKDPENEDETNITEVPDIRKLQVDVENDSDPSFTFGSLIGEGQPNKTNRRRSLNVDSFIDEKKRR